MAVISPPILKILSDLDIDLMDVDNDMDYLRALMEATNSLTISNPSDRRIPILQKEVKRVRDNRRAKSQIVKKKVSTSKLLNRKDVGEKGKESDTGKLARILRDTRGRVLSNEKRFDNLKPEENQQEGSDNQSFNPIIDGLNSIIETLKSERKFDKKKEEKQRKEKEKNRRAVKEKIIEGGKGVWKSVQKAGAVILGPFQKVWNDLLGFIGKIILGRVLFKLLDWLGDKKNQKKMKSIFKFIGDYWPVLLAGYLLFGNALTSFISGLLLKMVLWVPKMLFAIGKLMLNPWIAAAVGLGLTAAWLSTKKNKTDQNVDQSVEDVGKEETVNRLKEEKEDKNVLERMGGVITGEGQERDEQIQRVETGEERSYGRGGFTGEMIKGSLGPLGRILFNKGGTVPGSGNKDTVPAMLTPGEFVMSKGAVQKYGVDTLAGMNAAAGGTNRPTIMGGYKGGGKAADRSHFGTSGYRMGQVAPDQFVYSHEKYISTYKTKGGEVVEDSDDFKEIFGAIGMPDLIEHQTQLVDSIRRVPGYENINFMDVVQYPDGQGRLVGMPPEKLYPIFNASDANKATQAKMDEAIRIDEEAGTLYLDPRETAKAVGLNAGGLVPIQNFQGGGQVRQNRMKLSTQQNKKIATPGPITKKPKVTVAYQDQLNGSGSSNTPAGGNKKIPTFSAVSRRSVDKIRVLGISV